MVCQDPGALEFLQKCFWFYRFIYKKLETIRHNICMNLINPMETSLPDDPWCFEIPINFKPTYISMDLNVSESKIKDLISNNQWDVQVLSLLLGENVNSLVLSQGNVYPDAS